jgi:hypothetical protein
MMALQSGNKMGRCDRRPILPLLFLQLRPPLPPTRAIQSQTQRNVGPFYSRAIFLAYHTVSHTRPRDTRSAESSC